MAPQQQLRVYVCIPCVCWSRVYLQYSSVCVCFRVNLYFCASMRMMCFSVSLSQSEFEFVCVCMRIISTKNFCNQNRYAERAYYVYSVRFFFFASSFFFSYAQSVTITTHYKSTVHTADVPPFQYENKKLLLYLLFYFSYRRHILFFFVLSFSRSHHTVTQSDTYKHRHLCIRYYELLLCVVCLTYRPIVCIFTLLFMMTYSLDITHNIQNVLDHTKMYVIHNNKRGTKTAAEQEEEELGKK